MNSPMSHPYVTTCAGFRERYSFSYLSQISFEVNKNMGKTSWEARWYEVVDKNGDKFGEYVVKVDDEYAKCR